MKRCKICDDVITGAGDTCEMCHCCEFPTCSKQHEHKVWSRDRHTIMFLCTEHAEIVSKEQAPEYLCVCKNCGCWNPVN